MHSLTLRRVPRMGIDLERFLHLIKHNVNKAAEQGVDYLEYPAIPHIDGYYLSHRLQFDPDMERMNARVSYNSLAQRLGVTVYTRFRGAPCAWLAHELCRSANAFLRLDEQLLMGTFSSTGFQLFRAPFLNSCSFPEAYIMAARACLPAIVFQTGYTKSYKRLLDDKDLWLDGAPFHTNVVVLTKWSIREGDRVEGFIEIWRRGGRGHHAERHVLFPPPAPGSVPSSIRFRRADFYAMGGAPFGTDPDDSWAVSVDDLRRRASEVIRGEGYVPAFAQQPESSCQEGTARLHFTGVR